MTVPRYCIFADNYGDIYEDADSEGEYCRCGDVEKALAEKDAAYNLLAEASRALVIEAARPFLRGEKP